MANSDTLTPTTQRAYTLRLHDADKNDRSWCLALWATHEAVNKGAKVFGDWEGSDGIGYLACSGYCELSSDAGAVIDQAV